MRLSTAVLDSLSLDTQADFVKSYLAKLSLEERMKFFDVDQLLDYMTEVDTNKVIQVGFKKWREQQEKINTEMERKIEEQKNKIINDIRKALDTKTAYFLSSIVEDSIAFIQVETQLYCSVRWSDPIIPTIMSKDWEAVNTYLSDKWH